MCSTAATTRTTIRPRPPAARRAHRSKWSRSSRSRPIQFDVEFGRTTGGVVNAITKRGSNTFRGSAFGYLTNSAMTAPSILSLGR